MTEGSGVHRRILPPEVIVEGAPHGGFTTFFSSSNPPMTVGVYESVGTGNRAPARLSP
ncbi:hypothetical protein [Hypericibacter sp.]|uniref:hypothetical protein n=1 Tax=Hypericibacter sp. TaxID=2705401 RepID=UPI003D6D38A7